MIRHHFLAGLFLLSASVTAAAAPHRWAPDLQHLDAIPMHSLPAINMQKAVTVAVSKNNPLQFAVPASVPLTLDDGSWQKLDDGSWSWRTRIFSAGAQTLNLHFSQFSLPEGASLMLYDPTGTAIAGPYTEDSASADGQLWTSIVKGDTVVAEIRAPAAVKDQVRLQLGEVNHGYRNIAKSGVGQFGDSGSCETNVVCPVGQPFLTRARALALITISGQYICSGQLVNNVRRDNTPYFLTAYHCGITNSTASSVVFYWNYQSTVCSPSNEPASNQSQSGSTWVAGDATADFTLIKTAQQPDSSYNLYLAGWDASDNVPQSGGVVHHPEGDVTKISTYSAPARSVDGATLCLDNLAGTVCTNSRKVNVWQISYSQGVTEGGSSGSALYNENGLIVGQLSGGSTSCSASNSTTSDLFGRTNYAWTKSSSNSNGQLKANLDPDNTGTLTLGGQNLGTFSGSTTTLSSGASGGGGGGGGAFAPLTLAGLAMLGLLRRRAISRRASSV